MNSIFLVQARAQPRILRKSQIIRNKKLISPILFQQSLSQKDSWLRWPKQLDPLPILKKNSPKIEDSQSQLLKSKLKRLHKFKNFCVMIALFNRRSEVQMYRN